MYDGIYHDRRVVEGLTPLEESTELQYQARYRDFMRRCGNNHRLIGAFKYKYSTSYVDVTDILNFERYEGLARSGWYISWQYYAVPMERLK